MIGAGEETEEGGGWWIRRWEDEIKGMMHNLNTDTEEAAAGVASGVDYAATTAKPGRSKGPPFVYVWSAVLKVIFHKTENVVLREALREHMNAFNDHRKMVRVVRHCTVHVQRNQKWASVIVHVHSSIENLWNLIREHFLKIGGKEFESPIPPRGPIIRQIRALAQDLDV